MKKYILSLILLFTVILSAKSMSFEQARAQALFLTDKMAYELNLTEEQYEAAYEINLDYLLSINSADDVSGELWTHRNIDFGHILFDWQYRSYVRATYFYKPIWWDAGSWHFGIYSRYPRRDYYYFGTPNFYTAYRGLHSWRMNGGRSWYSYRKFNKSAYNGRQFGMRDGFQRGDYRNGYDFARSNNKRRSFGNQRRELGESRGANLAPRRSSTRTTVGRGANAFRSNNTGGTFSRDRVFGGSTTRPAPNKSFTPSGSNRTFRPANQGGGSKKYSPFGGHR